MRRPQRLKRMTIVLRFIGVMAAAVAGLATVGPAREFAVRSALVQTGAASNVRLPDEAAGYDGVAQALVSAFDHVDIIALGEDHGRKVDSDLRIAVVRHPDFAKKVRSIVVEFVSRSEQSTLDRYIRGDSVSGSQLAQVWKTTSSGPQLDSPFFAALFAAVRDVNAKLPADARVRVLGGDPGLAGALNRDAAAVSILKEQVIRQHGKALVIYGAAHFYRSAGDRGDVLAATGGGIVKTLEAEYPGRTLAIMPVGGPVNAPDITGPDLADYQKFDRALKTPVRPVLVPLGRLPFRDFTAEEFIGRKLLNCRNAGACVSAFKGSTLTLGQMADAVVYFGTTGVEPRPGSAR
jgi:hypothetical protein